jgi:hypothetical protein
MNIGRVLKRRFVEVLTTFNVDYSELQAAGWAVLWGIWVIIPWWDAVGFRGRSDLLNFITQGQEWIWGAISLSIGVFHFIGLMLDTKQLREMLQAHAWTTDVNVTTIRKVNAILSFTLWSFIAWAYLMTNWQSIAWWFYTILAIASLRAWVILRSSEVSGNGRHVESNSNGDRHIAEWSDGGKIRRVAVTERKESVRRIIPPAERVARG